MHASKLPFFIIDRGHVRDKRVFADLLMGEFVSVVLFSGMHVTHALLAFGVDIACFQKRHFGKCRSDDFVNKYGKQRNVGNDNAHRAKRHSLDCHAQRYARLRQQRDAQIFCDIFIAVRELRAKVCARIFTSRTCKDIHNADKHDYPVGKHGKFKFRAAQHEEQHQKGRTPTFYARHKFFREITNVAKYRTEHHANEQGRECDMYAAYFKGEHGKGNRQEYECDGNGQTFGSGMEETFAEIEKETHRCAKAQGKDYFQYRF